MQRPPPRPVHQECGDERHRDHDGADADGREFRALVRQARAREQTCRIIENLKIYEQNTKIGLKICVFFTAFLRIFLRSLSMKHLTICN